MWGHCSTRILLYFIWTVNKFFQAVNVQKMEQCCPNCIFSLIHFTVKNKVSGIWSDGIRNQLTQFKYLKSNTPAGNASRPQIHFLFCMSAKKDKKLCNVQAARIKLSGKSIVCTFSWISCKVVLSSSLPRNCFGHQHKSNLLIDSYFIGLNTIYTLWSCLLKIKQKEKTLCERLQVAIPANNRY